MGHDRISGSRIMVVEDEFHVARQLGRGLQAASAVVLGPAPSVDAALDLLNSAPDAAVLDINLRGEMAYGVADALVASGVPFLFATGYDESSLPQQYASVLHLQKPVEMTTLLRALNSLLEGGAGTIRPDSTGRWMFGDQSDDSLRQIVSDFEALVSAFDRAISNHGADGHSPDCQALMRARDGALRGLDLTRLALPKPKDL